MGSFSSWIRCMLFQCEFKENIPTDRTYVRWLQQGEATAREECPQIAHTHFRWCPSNMWPKVLTHVALLFHHCCWSVQISCVWSRPIHTLITSYSSGQRLPHYIVCLSPSCHEIINRDIALYACNWTSHNTNLWPLLPWGLLFYKTLKPISSLGEKVLESNTT